MDNNSNSKLEFQNILTALMENAIQNQHKISKEAIAEAFLSLDLDPSLYDNIYQYLREQNITITDTDNSFHETTDLSSGSQSSNVSEAASAKSQGLTEEMIMTAFAPPEDLDISSEEKEFIQLYLDELNSITLLSVSEEASLIRQYYQNTDNSLYKEQLIHNSLFLVIHSVEAFKDKGVSEGDLIQEGNLGLLEGMASFEIEEGLNEKQLITMFHSHLTEAIESAMTDAIHEQLASSDIGEHLANRANTLDRASKELSKKLNREPTIQELSEHLGLPEDEIQNIIKYSMDALTVQADTKVV